MTEMGRALAQVRRGCHHPSAARFATRRGLLRLGAGVAARPPFVDRRRRGPALPSGDDGAPCERPAAEPAREDGWHGPSRHAMMGRRGPARGGARHSRVRGPSHAGPPPDRRPAPGRLRRRGGRPRGRDAPRASSSGSSPRPPVAADGRGAAVRRDRLGRRHPRGHPARPASSGGRCSCSRTTGT